MRAVSLGADLETRARPDERGPGGERVRVRQNTETVSDICDPHTHDIGEKRGRVQMCFCMMLV